MAAAPQGTKPPDRQLQLNTVWPTLPKVKNNDIFDGNDIASLTLVLDGFVSEVPILRNIYDGAEPPSHRHRHG